MANLLKRSFLIVALGIGCIEEKEFNQILQLGDSGKFECFTENVFGRFWKVVLPKTFSVDYKLCQKLNPKRLLAN